MSLVALCLSTFIQEIGMNIHLGGKNVIDSTFNRGKTLIVPVKDEEFLKSKRKG